MRESVIIKILTVVAIILFLIVSYGVYTGFKVKAAIASLQSEISQLNIDKNNLVSEKNALQEKNDLLIQDVAKIYKTCLRENACKGHYPGVSWYCNNVGDESLDNPSHICICDTRCDLNATEIK